MGLVAQTNIKYGDAEGVMTLINAGEEVPEGAFSEEDLELLRENGSVFEPEFFISGADQADRIAELEAQIAELQSELAGNQTNVLAGTAEGSSAINPQAGVPAGEEPPQPDDDEGDGEVDFTDLS
jgi:hypothetical protein